MTKKKQRKRKKAKRTTQVITVATEADPATESPVSDGLVVQSKSRIIVELIQEMNNQLVVCDEAEYAYACTRLLSDKQPDSSTFYGLATKFHNQIETTPRVMKVQTLDLDAIHKGAEAVAVKAALAEIYALPPREPSRGDFAAL